MCDDAQDGMCDLAPFCGVVGICMKIMIRENLKKKTAKSERRRFANSNTFTLILERNVMSKEESYLIHTLS
jgi:hypothetical protein